MEGGVGTLEVVAQNVFDNVVGVKRIRTNVMSSVFIYLLGVRRIARRIVRWSREIL